jgi:hypothetical protein
VVQFQNLDYLLLCGLCGPSLRALRLKVLKTAKYAKDFAQGARKLSDKFKLHHYRGRAQVRRQ